MTSPGNVDLVRVLEPFFGGDTQARDVSGIICQFSGYMCGNKAYMRFRAGALTRVFGAQSVGCHAAHLWATAITDPFNEAFANWLTTDLMFLGYAVEPLYRQMSRHLQEISYRDPETYMIVSWESRTRGIFPVCLRSRLACDE